MSGVHHDSWCGAETAFAEGTVEDNKAVVNEDNKSVVEGERLGLLKVKQYL